MLPTYNRIGTVAVHGNGQCEIRLRSEYRYDWNLDDVKLQYTDDAGKIYEVTYTSLDALYNAVEKNETIVLNPII